MELLVYHYERPFQVTKALAIFFFILISETVFGQLDHNYKNNFSIGSEILFGRNEFPSDSISAIGFGVGFSIAYYPIDFKKIGIGFSFDPNYLRTFGDIKVLGSRVAISARFLGRDSKDFPIGIEYKFGLQTLNVRERLFGENMSRLSSTYDKIILLIPSESSNVFFSLTRFSKERNAGFEISVGINALFSKLFSGSKEENFISY